MECNKDEAARAKEIAEKKFMAKDIMGAKKFALKAQTLFPGLEGIPQLLAKLDVYIFVDNKINGEADWYGILGVDPLANDETVRKQFRKQALLLHPDKNKSVGAAGAFKHVYEAWSLLSDKAKRAAYDQKRNAKGCQEGAFTKTSTSNARAQKNTRRAGPSSTSSSAKPKPDTFLTVCHQCSMQFKYVRIYLNRKLLCPKCHKPFFAMETAPPPHSSKPSTPGKSSQQQQSASHPPHSSKPSTPGKGSQQQQSASHPPHSSKPSTPGKSSQQQQSASHQAASKNTVDSGKNNASADARAARMVKLAYEKAKREREEAQTDTKMEEASLSKKMGLDFCSAKRRRGIQDVSRNSYGRDAASQMGLGNISIHSTS